MAAYFQMGHDTENLVGEEGLEMFTGIILSPVNRPATELEGFVGRFRDIGLFDIVLDPQLYCPKVEHRHLPSHPYFPSDLETANLSSAGWWQQIAGKVADYGRHLRVDAVCSPAVLPTKWSDGYYLHCAESYTTMSSALAGSNIRPVMTLCVHLRELSDSSCALRIASIVTSCSPSSCYLVVEADEEPRREIRSAENLTSLLILIAALERTGCRVISSHMSSDMILAKAAGASHCSTGKFWNLRRFTRGRFEDSDAGGRQMPYWFEQGLMAFLREADIARIRRDGNSEFLCVGESDNLFARQILEQFANQQGGAWVRLGWRQFLGWFGAVEARLSNSDPLPTVGAWLREAEQRWAELEDKDVLLDETRNDGSWIRKWRQALSDFRKTEW